MLEQDILDTLSKAKEFIEKCSSNDGVLCDLYNWGYDRENGKESLESLVADLSNSIEYLQNKWADNLFMDAYRKAILEIAKEQNGKSKTDN